MIFLLGKKKINKFATHGLICLTEHEWLKVLILELYL